MSGGGGGGGGGGGSILGMTQTDQQASSNISSQQGATGGPASDITMNNIASGSGQGPNSYADPGNQVTGNAYDEMIAQQQEAARQAALQQTNNYLPPRPQNVIANERKANVGIG